MGEYGASDLWLAVRAENITGIATNLIDRTIDINGTGGESKTTPLIEAVKKQSEMIVHWLVSCEADVYANDINGNNALVYATEIASGFDKPNETAESIKNFILTKFTERDVINVDDDAFHAESASMLHDLIGDLDDMPAPATIEQSLGHSRRKKEKSKRTEYPKNIMTNAQKRLYKKLTPKGLCLRNCGGGGDCLFNSVADQLCLLFPCEGHDRPLTGDNIRKMVCDFISKNRTPHEFIQISEQDQARYGNEIKPFEAYLEGLRDRHGWGCAFVVKMIARMLEIPIRVWSSAREIPGEPSRDYDEYLIKGDDGLVPWNGKWIVIANETEVHFQSVGSIGDKRTGMRED